MDGKTGDLAVTGGECSQIDPDVLCFFDCALYLIVVVVVVALEELTNSCAVVVVVG